jgi:hypothetical protein
MQPIPGVQFLQADFISPETDPLVHAMLTVEGNPEGKADVILSDMAPNMSGNVVRDVERSLEICEGVYEFARRRLKRPGRRGGGGMSSLTKGGTLLYVSGSLFILVLTGYLFLGSSILHIPSCRGSECTNLCQIFILFCTSNRLQVARNREKDIFSAEGGKVSMLAEFTRPSRNSRADFVSCYWGPGRNQDRPFPIIVIATVITDFSVVMNILLLLLYSKRKVSNVTSTVHHFPLQQTLKT